MFISYVNTLTKNNEYYFICDTAEQGHGKY